jgi:hypothetical protein
LDGAASAGLSARFFTGCGGGVALPSVVTALIEPSANSMAIVWLRDKAAAPFTGVPDSSLDGALGPRHALGQHLAPLGNAVRQNVRPQMRGGLLEAAALVQRVELQPATEACRHLVETAARQRQQLVERGQGAHQRPHSLPAMIHLPCRAAL